MFAIISKLDHRSAENVSSLWHDLCCACGLRGIYNLPTPHFSWFVAEGILADLIMPCLSQIAKTEKRFSTQTFGFGVFSGEKPVLYLPLVKSAQMISMNESIWEAAAADSDQPNNYYSPTKWLPHITLALDDLDHDNLTCAVDQLAFQPLAFEILVENLILAQYDGYPPGKLLKTFDLVE